MATRQPSYSFGAAGVDARKQAIIQVQFIRSARRLAFSVCADHRKQRRGTKKRPTSAQPQSRPVLKQKSFAHDSSRYLRKDVTPGESSYTCVLVWHNVTVYIGPGAYDVGGMIGEKRRTRKTTQIAFSHEPRACTPSMVLESPSPTKRYFSKGHLREQLGTTSPGPGLYKTKSSLSKSGHSFGLSNRVLM